MATETEVPPWEEFAGQAPVSTEVPPWEEFAGVSAKKTLAPSDLGSIVPAEDVVPQPGQVPKAGIVIRGKPYLFQNWPRLTPTEQKALEFEETERRKRTFKPTEVPLTTRVGRAFTAPHRAAALGPGTLGAVSDESLRDYIDVEWDKMQREKPATPAESALETVAGLGGTVHTAITGGIGGPWGIAAMFGSQGAHDAFLRAAMNAKKEGKSTEEAVAIGKALAPVGATVQGAMGAAFPAKIPGTIGGAARAGLAPSAIAGYGTLAENIIQQQLGLKTPLGESVGENVLMTELIPPAAHVAGRGLGAVVRKLLPTKTVEPTIPTERPTDAVSIGEAKKVPVEPTPRDSGAMGEEVRQPPPPSDVQAQQAKAGEQPAPTSREGTLDIGPQRALDELQSTLSDPTKPLDTDIAVKLGKEFKSPEDIAKLREWHDNALTQLQDQRAQTGLGFGQRARLAKADSFVKEALQSAEKAPERPAVEALKTEEKPPQVSKPTIPPALDEALKGIASQKQPGEVWLYHGEGGPQGAGLGGSWFTTDPSKAISYGPKVSAVAVKAADLAKYSMKGKKGEYVLPSELVNKSRELGTFEQPAFELEAPKAAAEPTPVTEPAPELQPVGAATPADVKATQSDMAQLAQTMENVASPAKTATQRVAEAKQAVANLKTEVPKNIGEMARNGVERLSAIGSAIKTGLTKLPQFTEFKKIMGQWLGANQQADLELRQFVKNINKNIRQDRQVAITNYIQADGDAAVLRQRADASKTAKLRKGYEDALTLNRDEKIAADQIRMYLDNRLQEGIDSGILDHGLENYITQIWKRPNAVTQKLISDISIGKLQPNFRYARQRLFESYFEGEQKGLVPANKAVSALIAAYDQSFNRSLAARSFIKNLTEGKASDGRPLVEVSGSGRLVGEEGSNQAVLVKSKTKPEDIADYRTIDHPALRKWKWASKTPDGTNVFVEGQLLVHPEIYNHLRNVLSRSAFRQYAFPRAVLKTEALIKELMFSASGFHQVQETLHALGHRVNPTNLETLDMSKPWLKEGVEHGLQIADYNALENFSEGLSSGPIIKKFPLVGKRLLGPYTEWLFQDNIPRIKATMYKHAMERNLERFQSQLNTGKITRDQVAELTAKQANAAFGELNYKWMGRNPTFQDALRTFLIAPDFLEARGRFVGQALKPYGREQLVALGLLAATQYITARILNQIFDKNPHLEPENAFKLIVGKHSYELRSVPGDILHLLSKPHQFATARISPLVRQAIEGITGRDWRGVKRDALEQVKDFARLPTPISLRREDDQRWWETFLNVFGVHERSYTAGQEIADLARKYRESVKGKPVVEVLEDTDSPYRKLRVSLDVGNKRASIEALRELRKTHKDKDILQSMKRSLSGPFTGMSKAEESKFRQSLSPVESKKYEEALAERRERYKKFQMLISQGI